MLWLRAQGATESNQSGQLLGSVFRSSPQCFGIWATPGDASGQKGQISKAHRPQINQGHVCKTGMWDLSPKMETDWNSNEFCSSFDV